MADRADASVGGFATYADWARAYLDGRVGVPSPNRRGLLVGLLTECDMHANRADAAERKLTESRGALTVAAELIDRLAEESACNYDHHNNCRTHSLHKRPCPHPLGRQFVTAWRAVEAEQRPGSHCPWCGTAIQLGADGLVPSHENSNYCDECPGTGRRPSERVADDGQ